MEGGSASKATSERQRQCGVPPTGLNELYALLFHFFLSPSFFTFSDSLYLLFLQ